MVSRLFLWQYHACAQPYKRAIAYIGRAEGKKLDLPHATHIIICPPNLTDQWMSEIQKYLQYGSYTVLPYYGTCTEKNRESFQKLWEQTENTTRIILTTYSVSLHFLLPHTLFTGDKAD